MMNIRLARPIPYYRLLSLSNCRYTGCRGPILRPSFVTSRPLSSLVSRRDTRRWSSTDKAPSEKQPLPPKLSSDVSTEICTIPNLLTLSRILATPFIGYFIASGQSTPAISLFTISCLTDLVDGFIARKFNMKSVLGSILDPAADKFLMTTCTVALSIQGSMPLYAACAILGRDVALSLIAMYIRYKALPSPVTVSKFLDMSITTHTVHPNTLGKYNTAFQMLYIGGLVLKPVAESFLGDLSESFTWFSGLVTVCTVASGLSYLVGKNSFRAISSGGR